MTVINGVNMKALLTARRERFEKSEAATKAGLTVSGFFHTKNISSPIETFTDKKGVCYVWDKATQEFVKLSTWLAAYYILTKEASK